MPKFVVDELDNQLKNVLKQGLLKYKNKCISILENFRVWERHLAEQKKLEEQAQKLAYATQSKPSDLRMQINRNYFFLRLSILSIETYQNQVEVLI